MNESEWDALTAKLSAGDRQVVALALVPEGGNWRDLPPYIAADVMGAAFSSGGGRTGYMRRLAWDKPSPTIIGSPSQRSTFMGHPTELRPISAKEAAVLQSYPDDFIFKGGASASFQQVGNSVPPRLAVAALLAVWS